MAKKFSKLVARVEALEKAIGRFLSGGKPARKKAAKKTKSRKAVRKASVKKKTAKKPPARKAKKIVAKAMPARRKASTKRTTARKTTPAAAPSQPRRKRVLPTIAQLAPGGAPEFVTPLDKV